MGFESVLTKLCFGKKVGWLVFFFQKRRKNNHVVTQMVHLAECKRKEIIWFHFSENKASEQRVLVSYIRPSQSHAAAQNDVPASGIT